jgi:hypothetical protein
MSGKSLSAYDYRLKTASFSIKMLAEQAKQAHLSVHRCNSSGQLPARAAILRQAALTSRYSAVKNRALFAAGGELRPRRNGRPVSLSSSVPFHEGAFGGMAGHPEPRRRKLRRCL